MTVDLYFYGKKSGCCAASFVIAVYDKYGWRNPGPQDLRALHEPYPISLVSLQYFASSRSKTVSAKIPTPLSLPSWSC
jgi:hypothetical protein